MIVTYVAAESEALDVVREIQHGGRKAVALRLDVRETQTFDTFAVVDELVAVHLKGPFFLTQKLLPVVSDGGAIVNVSTGLTRYAYPGFAAYSAVKSGLDTLTSVLAVELGSRRINVNAVAPGGIVTDFGGGVMRDPSLQQAVAADTPLGRVGEPADVADVIAVLLAPETRWITGQRIEVTGGYRL